VLRLVGARDRLVAGIVARRAGMAALVGAALGAALGLIAVGASGDPGEALVLDLGLRGSEALLTLPLVAGGAAIAAAAAYATARRTLARMD
jgi:ABC-type antimicrobial peptide transport system permease subunit